MFDNRKKRDFNYKKDRFVMTIVNERFIKESTKLDHPHRITDLTAKVKCNYKELMNISAEDQTEEMIDIALRQHWNALHYAKNPTDAQILKSIQMNGAAIKNVPISRQTEDLCLEAIKIGSVITHPFLVMAVQTKKICIAALRRASFANALEVFKGIKNKDREICTLAVQKNYKALAHVPDSILDEDIYLSAISEYNDAATFCEGVFSKEFFERSLQLNPSTFACFNPTKINAENLFTRENCLKAIKDDWSNLQYIPRELLTEEICLAAYEQDILTLRILSKVHFSLPALSAFDRERRMSYSLHIQKKAIEHEQITLNEEPPKSRKRVSIL